MLYIHDGAFLCHIDIGTKRHHLQRKDRNWRLLRETVRLTQKNKQLMFLSYTETFLKGIKLPRCYLSYFPTAVTKATYEKKHWMRAYSSRSFESMAIVVGSMAIGRQGAGAYILCTSMSWWTMTRKGVDFRNLKACPQWQTSSNKTVSLSPYQTADQLGTKNLHIWAYGVHSPSSYQTDTWE